jgi:hypothetical protein
MVKAELGHHPTVITPELPAAEPDASAAHEGNDSRILQHLVRPPIMK